MGPKFYQNLIIGRSSSKSTFLEIWTHLRHLEVSKKSVNFTIKHLSENMCEELSGSKIRITQSFAHMSLDLLSNFSGKLWRKWIEFSIKQLRNLYFLQPHKPLAPSLPLPLQFLALDLIPFCEFLFGTGIDTFLFRTP